MNDFRQVYIVVLQQFLAWSTRKIEVNQKQNFLVKYWLKWPRKKPLNEQFW